MIFTLISEECHSFQAQLLNGASLPGSVSGSRRALCVCWRVLQSPVSRALLSTTGGTFQDIQHNPHGNLNRSSPNFRQQSTHRPIHEFYRSHLGYILFSTQ